MLAGHVVDLHAPVVAESGPGGKPEKPESEQRWCHCILLEFSVSKCSLTATMTSRTLIGMAGLTGLTLVACQTTTNPPGAHRTTTATTPAALNTVAGTWIYSHAGPSPVAAGGTDLVTEANEKLKATRILIQPDGTASMVALGQSGSFKVEVLEETPLYIRLGSPKQAREEAWTYDKATKLIAFPMKVTAGSTSGFMPAYFKRASH
jgi:hypothetical protein